MALLLRLSIDLHCTEGPQRGMGMCVREVLCKTAGAILKE